MSSGVEETSSQDYLSDDDWDLPLIGINTPNAKLSDFKNKAIFLNFWGTWCPPCRAEWPSIEVLYKNNKTQVVFVLIAINDDEAKLRKFLQEQNYTAPVYLANAALSPLLLPQSFPTTLLINARGRIVKKETSALNWSQDSMPLFKLK